MLSYQHAYHAGNAIDVIKHTLWAHVLTQLIQKPNSLHVYETHAGRGLYPINAPEMQKLNEYQEGLAKLAWSTDQTNPYLQAVGRYNPTSVLTQIPGSPAIAAHILRPDDHLYLAEAHPAEFAHLKSAIHKSNLHLHLSDGHALMPRFIRRGNRTAVMLDPAYEVKTEYAQTVETVANMLEANPQATIVVWYPLLAAGHYKTLITGLTQLKAEATWRAEYTWAEPQTAAKGWGAHGTGNIILNLPYKLEGKLTESLQQIVPNLHGGKGKLLTHFLTARE